jgi:hypothetical protein
VSTLAITRFNQAVTEMIGHLEAFLPAPGNPPFPSTLTVLEAAERPVGVGNFQGNVERGPIAVLGVRGGRVQARVRYDVRGATAQAAALAVGQVQEQVRAARLDPARRDFLVLEPDGGDPAVPMGENEGWRQGVEYRVLYEYRYEDPEDAGSLLVRVDVKVRGEHHEDDAVTRELTLWDRKGAPPLVLRGPRTVGRLTLLSHTEGGVPAGQVVIRRTFDGAPPAQELGYGLLDRFARGMLPPRNQRSSRHVLDVQELLDAFAPAGPPVMLARLSTLPNPPQPGVPAAFVPRVWDGLRGVRLETPADRLEIRYLPPRFPAGSAAALYLGTARGPTA